MSIIVLRIKPEELLNIETGLNLLKQNMLKKNSEVSVYDVNASNMKDYYSAKVLELDEQIYMCKKALNEA